MNLKKEIDVLKVYKDNNKILSNIEKSPNHFEEYNDKMLKSANFDDLSTLKKLSEGFGFSENKENYSIPAYNCNKKGENLIVKLEIPGNSNVNISILSMKEIY